MHGPTHRRFSRLRNVFTQGRLGPFLTALAILVVAAIVIITWLAVNAEETVQRRIAQSPSISVTIQKPPVTEQDDIETDEAEPEADATETPAPSSDTDKPADTAAVTAPDEQAPAVEKTPDAAPQDAEQKPAAETKPEPVPQPAPPPVQDAKPDTVARPDTETPPAAQTDNALATPVEAIAPNPVPPALLPLPETWQKQARAFNKDDPRPRIAIIITNLGIANAATQTAIQTLPPDVTLAFQSIAPNITDWISQARASGHETLLAVPMEPYNYPQNDPGPQTLLTSLDDSANVQRLEWALARSNEILGVMPAQGEKFVTNEKSLAPVLESIKRRGLVFVDATQNARSVVPSMAKLGAIPFAQSTLLIDAAASRLAIDKALLELEARAKADGSAIGIALPYPVTFERLNVWIKSLPEKNLTLAPISTMLIKGAPAMPTPVAAPDATTPAPAKP